MSGARQEDCQGQSPGGRRRILVMQGGEAKQQAVAGHRPKMHRRNRQNGYR